MLYAGWEVRKVKNCDRGLENAARGQHFQAWGHSFSLYGPTLSRQITYLFSSCDKIGLQVGLRKFVIVAYVPCTNHCKKSNVRTSK